MAAGKGRGREPRTRLRRSLGGQVNEDNVQEMKRKSDKPVKAMAFPLERIEQSILLIRGKKVMLDRDLAALYGVETKALKQAVKRNISRFPEDFMFVLTREELTNLRSQFVTSSSWGGLRYPPMAFTEQGVAMLSSILRSKRAIEINIAIMRTFVKLRQMLESHVKLARKLAELENRYDEQFRIVFEVLNELMMPPEPKRKQIGFGVKEPKAKYRTGKKKRNRVLA